MTNININIDLSKLGSWMEILATRVSHLNLEDVFFVILALVIPPLPVLIKVGFTSHFWINIILTLLGIIPGQIHALWVVLFL